MRKPAVLWMFCTLILLLPGFSPQSHAAATLKKIKAAGSLNCGVNTEQAEYSLVDAHGNHAHFDTELCKAIAAAVLGNGAHFKIVSFRDEAGGLKALKALKKGDIEVLATGSPYLRSDNGSFLFAKPILYDTQGLLVNKEMGIQSARDLAGKKVCFLIGTEIEQQVRDFMARENIQFIPGPFSEEAEMEMAFVTQNCAAITADLSQLAYERISFKKIDRHYEILPDIVAKDPLAPVVRNDDPQWAAIVDWTTQALIEAEENGITQANVATMKKSGNLAALRLLGVRRGWATYLGLDDEWAAREIEAVGNYGEIFDRTLGAKSPMKLDRGLNRLWTQGGLMIAEPIR